MKHTEFLNEISSNELTNINAGGKTPPAWLFKLMNECSIALDTVVTETENMAITCYNAGKKLGNYFSNFF